MRMIVKDWDMEELGIRVWRKTVYLSDKESRCSSAGAIASDWASRQHSHMESGYARMEKQSVENGNVPI